MVLTVALWLVIVSTYVLHQSVVDDQAGWTDEQILAAYRGQAYMERAIRQMKDPHFVSWRPMFHWTDIKIRVHAFSCVMALALASLLLRDVHRRAHARGMDPPADSIPELPDTLEGVPRRPSSRPAPRRQCEPGTVTSRADWLEALLGAVFSFIAPVLRLEWLRQHAQPRELRASHL